MTGPGPAEKKPTRATRGGASQPSTPAADAASEPSTPRADDRASPLEATGATPPRPKVPRGAKAVGETPSAATEPAAMPVTPGAAAVHAPVAAVAAPTPTPAPAPDVSGPVDAGPGAPGTPAPRQRSTPDVAAAVDKAIDRLREHLTMGEIVAGAGAVIILGIAWAIFGILFDQKGALPGPVVVVAAAALLASLVLQNAKVHDFGPSYRLIVTGLSMTLGLLAAVDIIQRLRWAFSGWTFDLGGLSWWAGAVVAVLGGWMVWREARQDS